MSITYSNSLKSTRMNAVITALGTAGKLVLKTAGDVVLATIPLANPAGTVTGAGTDTLTFTAAGMSDPDAAATGVATKAELQTSGSVVVASGLTVGTSASDVILANTTINQHNVVTITSATITHG